MGCIIHRNRNTIGFAKKKGLFWFFLLNIHEALSFQWSRSLHAISFYRNIETLTCLKPCCAEIHILWIGIVLIGRFGLVLVCLRRRPHRSRLSTPLEMTGFDCLIFWNLIYLIVRFLSSRLRSSWHTLIVCFFWVCIVISVWFKFFIFSELVNVTVGTVNGLCYFFFVITKVG